MYNEMISHRETLQQTKRSSSSKNLRERLSLIFSELPWYICWKAELIVIVYSKARERVKKVESAPKKSLKGFLMLLKMLFHLTYCSHKNANGVFLHAIKVHRNVIINKKFYFKSKTFSSAYAGLSFDSLYFFAASDDPRKHFFFHKSLDEIFHHFLILHCEIHTKKGNVCLICVCTWNMK